MDPNQCLLELLMAAYQGDHEALTEHAENLAEWLHKGGFPPAPVLFDGLVDRVRLDYESHHAIESKSLCLLCGNTYATDKAWREHSEACMDRASQ